MRRPRRLLALGAVVLSATACTPQQISDWVEWNDRDPVAAQEFANLPAVQAQLHERPAASSGGGGGNGWTSGDCDSFAEEAAAAGLPWGTFSRIAWRESGCNPNVWVVDSDDDGGGLFGFNYKGSMINYWGNLCGMSKGEVRGNVALQMECAAEQYHRHGMGAWSTR